jgi:hypothetical protein
MPAPRQRIDNPPGIEDQGLGRWQLDVADELNSLDKAAQTQQFFERAEDPDDPLEGTTVLWMTSGGDLKAKVTVGGVTKTATIVDFSAL